MDYSPISTPWPSFLRSRPLRGSDLHEGSKQRMCSTPIQDNMFSFYSSSSLFMRFDTLICNVQKKNLILGVLLNPSCAINRPELDTFYPITDGQQNFLATEPNRPYKNGLPFLLQTPITQRSTFNHKMFASDVL